MRKYNIVPNKSIGTLDQRKWVRENCNEIGNLEKTDTIGCSKRQLVFKLKGSSTNRKTGTTDARVVSEP